MPSQDPTIKKLKKKLVDIKYSEKPQKSKINMPFPELVKKAQEVRKTFSDEDLARFNFT